MHFPVLSGAAAFHSVFQLDGVGACVVKGADDYILCTFCYISVPVHSLWNRNQKAEREV